MENKKAWVLSGGGSRGSFQVGIMDGLSARGEKPDLIVGTSVGALNAGAYKYIGMNNLREIWESIRSRKDIIRYKWNALWSDGLFSTKPLKKLLDKHMSDEIISSQPDDGTKAVVVSVNIENGHIAYIKSDSRATWYNPNYERLFTPTIKPKEETFPRKSKYPSYENFRKWMVKSATIPLVMSSGSEWYDGGLRENAALDYAVKRGYKDITVILTQTIHNPFGLWKWKKKRFMNFVYQGIRSLDILQSELLLNDLKIKRYVDKLKKYNHDIRIRYYAPKIELGHILDFSHSNITDNILYGVATVVEGGKDGN